MRVPGTVRGNRETPLPPFSPVGTPQKKGCRGGCMTRLDPNNMVLSRREIRKLFSKTSLNPSTGCLEWSLLRDKDGYGKVTFRGLSMKTHRLAWMASFGPIPQGALVLHRCDNPPCMNAEGGHLFLGSHAENMADMKAKRRGRNAASSTSKT